MGGGVDVVSPVDLRLFFLSPGGSSEERGVVVLHVLCKLKKKVFLTVWVESL